MTTATLERETTTPTLGGTCACGHSASAHFIQVGSCNQCGCGAFR